MKRNPKRATMRFTDEELDVLVAALATLDVGLYTLLHDVIVRLQRTRSRRIAVNERITGGYSNAALEGG